MRNSLFILVACIAILFTSCNKSDFDDEKEMATVITTRTISPNPLYPIIFADNVNGYWIDLVYMHPTQYTGMWKMYLQYQNGSVWKYYNPSGNNTPYTISSGESNSRYMIGFAGNYLPKGRPVIRICIDEYAPNGSRSTWSEPYQLENNNQYGITLPPNFDGVGDYTLELYGTLRPSISSVHSAKIQFAISGTFENSPIKKQYNIDWVPGSYYFSTRLEVEPYQNYTLSYIVSYYDYTGRELVPIDKGSYFINVGGTYSNYFKIFD